MRVMVLIKATRDTEAGIMPDEKILTEMGSFNEELVKAGVLLAGEGVQPSSRGKRVQFAGSKRTVVDGPFTETNEVIGGFAILEARSMQDAVELTKRFLAIHGTEWNIECEVRQMEGPEMGVDA